MRLSTWLRHHLAALRALLVLTVLTGIAYPLVVTGIAQLPGLKGKANGSLIRNAAGTVVGSALLGQSFVDGDGDPLPRYFQSRPSAAGGGYDPTATSASNLGPESIVDSAGRQSLLTQVCARSRAVGDLEGVNGARPFCTPDGVGAVLAVFADHAVSVNQACPATPFVQTYQGRPVECAEPGTDYAAGQIVPVRGDAPAQPAVPADAVTASASGLDPGISTAYARLQAPRVARARGITVAEVLAMVAAETTSRTLGFMGEPSVNVLRLNLDLDREHPAPR